jgi:hypothetical protein
MPLIGWLFVLCAAAAAFAMATFITRRERLALPDRQRRFVGIHELLMPFDEQRYQQVARRYHELAQKAFLLTGIFFIATILVLILTE